MIKLLKSYFKNINKKTIIKYVIVEKGDDTYDINTYEIHSTDKKQLVKYDDDPNSLLYTTKDNYIKLSYDTKKDILMTELVDFINDVIDKAKNEKRNIIYKFDF